MKIILLLILFIVSKADAQLTASAEHLQFPETPTGSKDSLTLVIENTSGTGVTIDSFKHYSERFSFSDSLFTIPANGNVSLKIYYLPKHNIIDYDLLLFRSLSEDIVLAVTVAGSGKYNDTYYNSTFNLHDNALKAALLNLVNNHTSLGYNLARDKMYMEIDNKKVNGQGTPVNTLECVYTGREAVGYIDRQDAQNNYGFNTEHTWPQSFFGSSEPMMSDLYHLFPTDATANNIRGNLDFGRVVSNIDWQVGGSKRGRDSLNVIVFEPRDVHKGNVARSLLYFVIRHTNRGNFLDQKQEDIFRIWNYTDPADTIERKRNADISLYQQKRNPFIDHPEFIDRIYSFVTNNERPEYALIEALPEAIFFDSTDTGDTASVFFYLLNGGNDELIINNIEVSNPFNVIDPPMQVDPFSYEKIFISFAPDSAGYYNSFVVINSIAGSDTVNVSGYGTGNVTLVNNNINKPALFELHQNYPNPFNPVTKIKFSLPREENVRLILFNTLGEEISLLINEEMKAGVHEYIFDASYLSSGVYFYSIQTGEFKSTKKLVLLR